MAMNSHFLLHWELSPVLYWSLFSPVAIVPNKIYFYCFNYYLVVAFSDISYLQSMTLLLREAKVEGRQEFLGLPGYSPTQKVPPWKAAQPLPPLPAVTPRTPGRKWGEEGSRLGPPWALTLCQAARASYESSRLITCGKSVSALTSWWIFKGGCWSPGWLPAYHVHLQQVLLLWVVVRIKGENSLCTFISWLGISNCLINCSYKFKSLSVKKTVVKPLPLVGTQGHTKPEPWTPKSEGVSRGRGWVAQPQGIEQARLHTSRCPSALSSCPETI